MFYYILFLKPQTMTVLNKPGKRSPVLIILVFLISIFISCRDKQTPGQVPPQGGIKPPKHGQVFLWKTIYFKISDSIGSPSSRQKIAEVQQFYLQRIAEFNQKNENKISLAFQVESLRFSNGQLMAQMKNTVMFSAKCNPCTAPTTPNPPPPEIDAEETAQDQ